MIRRQHERLSGAELEKAAHRPISREEVLLSLAFLAPPGAWALQFALSYGLTYPAAQFWQSKSSLLLVLLAAVAVSVGSIALGVRGLRRAQALEGAERDRVHFMALCACVEGAFFVLAMLAQSVPVLMLGLGKH